MNTYVIFNKEFKIISLVTSVCVAPIIASQSTTIEPPATTTEMTKQATEDRKKTLKGIKGDVKLSDKDEKTIKAKSKARTIEQIGGKIVSTSDKVSGYLASSNFLTNSINLVNSLSPVPFLNPLIVAGLFNNVIGVVGQGIEAYGGYGLRNAALADMAFGKMIDVNDINEATKSIEALQEIEKRLTNQKTIKRALEKEGKNASKAKKLLIYLNPSHLENTITRFTDDLHITANQKNVEEKLVQIRDQRKKEEENYDNITRRLQSRFLNRVMLDFKDALDKVTKIKDHKLDLEQYKRQLQDDIEAAKKAKGMLKEKNPKKLESLRARQDIYINEVETRLVMFEKIYKDPDGAQKELNGLKTEMFAPSPKDKELSGITPQIYRSASSMPRRKSIYY